MDLQVSCTSSLFDDELDEHVRAGAAQAAEAAEAVADGTIRL